MTKRILIGESGGPTPVIDWEVAGALAAAQRLGWTVQGMVNGLQGLLNADIEGAIVDLTCVDPMAFVFNGPGAGLRTTRIKPKAPEYAVMAERLELLGIDAVIYFGGNDSAGHLLGLGEDWDGGRIHGIKTVDNDLPETHHTPGFGSAALFNATALKHVHSDYSSYGAMANFHVGGEIVPGIEQAPVTIYQVMGRNAGWLSLATGFAKVDPGGRIDPDRPPHIILCYEDAFDERALLDRVDRVITRLGEAVIVVGEDLFDPESGGSLVERYAEELTHTEDGAPELGGAFSFSTGAFLARRIQTALRVECVRGSMKIALFVPQHIQRSCMTSPVDAAEAYAVGGACVEALAAGETGKSVVLRRTSTRMTTALAEIEAIAGEVRHVEPEYRDGLDGPTQGFVDEFIPTIGGPAAIPHYAAGRFEAVPVPEALRARPYVKRKGPRSREADQWPP